MAEPGGINISRPTLDAAGEIPIRIESLGEKRLKNIPEPVYVFRLVDDEIETDPSLPWKRRIPTRDRPSLAVSPFVNLGSDEDSHFADGLMMALTISLMRIPGVDVVSEASTLQYRDRPFSSQQLGHELGVRYVLEGATQRAGSRVRVLTQLIDVDEGKTVWADRFETSLDDVFAAQDDIVSAIVTALDVEVIGGEIARSYREELSAEAVEIVYRGLQHMSHGTAEALQRAIEAFEEVIALEPDAPSGYTLAATNLNMAAMFGMAEDPVSNYARAEEYANRAHDLGDPTGISQAVLASVRLQQHDWDGALEAAQQATALRPSCDLSYGTAASVMRYLGRWEDAVEYADRATELSPVFSWWFQGIAANAEFVGENYEAAADIAEELAAGERVDFESILTLAASQAALGRNRYAAAALQHARRTRPELSAETLRAMLPYRDEETLTRFIEQLEAAGLE
jgi:adenylate cyclase